MKDATCARISASLDLELFQPSFTFNFLVLIFSIPSNFISGGSALVFLLPGYFRMEQVFLISAMFVKFVHRYSLEDTGPVSQIAWTPDNRAFAVGWRNRGLSVWSVSGCRLMCTIRQGSLSNSQSPAPGVDNERSMSEPMVKGVALLAWGRYAYELFAVERGSTLRFFEFRFAKR